MVLQEEGIFSKYKLIQIKSTADTIRTLIIKPNDLQSYISVSENENSLHMCI